MHLAFCVLRREIALYSVRLKHRDLYLNSRTYYWYWIPDVHRANCLNDTTLYRWWLTGKTFPDNAPLLQLDKELQEGKIRKTRTERNEREGSFPNGRLSIIKRFIVYQGIDCWWWHRPFINYQTIYSLSRDWLLGMATTVYETANCLVVQGVFQETQLSTFDVIEMKLCREYRNLNI